MFIINIGTFTGEQAHPSIGAREWGVGVSESVFGFYGNNFLRTELSISPSFRMLALLLQPVAEDN